MEQMPGYEHTNLKGITIKNIYATITTTAIVVGTVLASYYSLKSTMQQMRDDQETENKVTEIRLKLIEDNQKLMDGRITILEGQVRDLQNRRLSNGK